MDQFLIKKSKNESESLFKTIPLPDGKSSIILCSFIPKEIEVSKDLFSKIWELHGKEYQKVKIYGKEVRTPRWSDSFGKSYHFTGMNHKARSLDLNDYSNPDEKEAIQYLLSLLDWVKKHSGKEYNQVLINWYKDGNHYIGPHSDDESQLVPNSSIYSFSFGQTRDFIVKSKTDSSFKEVFEMKNNSLIIMGGEMQKRYKHEVPKRTPSKAPLPRINITFRLFK
jgi:alkylated DNA repair dioxygenase AlkB